MRYVRNISIFVLILLPVIAAFFVPTGVHAFGLSQGFRDAAYAQVNSSRLNETEALQTILSYEPWHYDKWLRLGELQYAMEEYQAAITTFATVDKAGKLTARGEFEYGKCFLALGEYEKARDIFRSVSERGVVDTRFLLELAEVQESINDSNGTKTTLLLAHGLDPNDHKINYALGVQLAATQPDDAVFFLNDALSDMEYQVASSALMNIILTTQVLGQDASRFIYIGQELSLLGEWEAASAAFLNSTAIDPKNAYAWALAGEAVQHVNGDGYPYLQKALELDPHSDIVNGLAALYYRRQSKLDVALIYLYAAAENNPNESTWQIEIGATLALQGNLEEALMHYQMATLMDSENWVTWRQLAAFCVLHNYKVDTEGFEAARRALLLNPDSPSLLDLMGTVYMIMDNLSEAERFYLQANQVAPNQAEILYHLGQLYMEKGDTKNALYYLQQAAVFATDNRIRENANRLIRQIGG